MDREKLAKDSFDLIRNSDELGRESMSSYDECYSDDELMEDLREHCSDIPETTTAQEVFEFYKHIEGIRLERENEFGDW